MLKPVGIVTKDDTAKSSPGNAPSFVSKSWMPYSVPFTEIESRSSPPKPAGL